MSNYDYEIIDDDGVIHSGNEEEMNFAFSVMKNPESFSKKARDMYAIPFKGDLKLVHIIATYR